MKDFLKQKPEKLGQSAGKITVLQMKKQALETIYMTSLQSIQYNGGNMTKEQLKRAKEIEFDIKVLIINTENCTRNSWIEY